MYFPVTLVIVLMHNVFWFSCEVWTRNERAKSIYLTGKKKDFLHLYGNLDPL